MSIKKSARHEMFSTIKTKVDWFIFVTFFNMTIKFGVIPTKLIAYETGIFEKWLMMLIVVYKCRVVCKVLHARRTGSGARFIYTFFSVLFKFNYIWKELTATLTFPLIIVPSYSAERCEEIL